MILKPGFELTFLEAIFVLVWGSKYPSCTYTNIPPLTGVMAISKRSFPSTPSFDLSYISTFMSIYFV